MITITKQNDGVLFTFQDSDKYLYGNGSILVPFNTLSIVADESDMITLKKAASNDVFLSARYDTDLGYRSKDDAIDELKGMLFAETGGGSESGMTPSEVQEMIDESISGKADTAVVNQAISEATQAILSVSGDVQTISGNTNNLVWLNSTENNDKLSNLFDQYTSGNSWDISYKSETNAALSGKADTSAVTAVANDVTVLSGDVTDKQDALQYYSEDAENKSAQIEIENTDLTSTTIFDYSQVDLSVAKVISDVQYNVYTNISDGGVSMAYDKSTGDDATDAHSYLNVEDGIISAEVYANEETTTFEIASTGVTINGDAVATEPYVDAAISGKVDTSAITTAITSGSTDDEIPTAKAVYDAIPTGGTSVTVDPTLDSGSNNPVANSAITTAIDNVKAYYIDFGVLTTQGIHDADWDGMVSAINTHRPIYAGLGSRYYTAECLYQDGGNRIIMTASDEMTHYFYTFTKNGSENYSFSYETRPYVTDAEKTLWNSVSGKADTTAVTAVNNVLTAHTADTTIHVTTAQTEAWNAKANIDHVTQAEYDSMITAGTLDSNTMYIIDDAVPFDPSTKVDVSAITSAITSGSTDSEIPTAKATYDAIQAGGGGGGATYSAGTNIEIDTANTINCTLNLANGSATGQGSIVIAPFGTTASGNRALAGGQLSSAGGEESIAYGCHAKTNSSAGSSFALGSYVETKSKYEAAFGTYNVSNRANFTFGNSGNTLFSVGNGTSSANHNAFEIRQNGDIYVNDGTNDVRLQDTILALGGLKLVKLTQAEYDALATKDSSTLYIISD